MNSQTTNNAKIYFDRNDEFPQLKDSVYIDHAGATLYSRSQMEATHQELLGNLYGNPHSRSQSSRLATDAIDQIRFRILKHFNTTSEEYTVIFTSGCTGALKLVAECFDFHNPSLSDTNSSSSKCEKTSKVSTDNNVIESSCHRRQQVNNKKTKTPNFGSTLTISSEIFLGESTLNNGVSDFSGSNTGEDTLNNGVSDYVDSSKVKARSGYFVYLLDNHTSVQGMREIVKEKVKNIVCIDEKDTDEFDLHFLLTTNSSGNQKEPALFAYPAQSNYSGRKYPLEWIQKVHQGHMSFRRSLPGRWFVLLDAASFVSTNDLDLNEYKPDFVTLSFYKMFGFPTGLGALLVKNDSSFILKKNYFGGGTVAVSSPTELFHMDRPNLSDRFEDGTLPYLDIIALRHGFDALNNLGGGMKTISHHTFAVAKYFHDCLRGIIHSNKQPLADIYCHGDFSDISSQGPIVNFNLLRQDGSFIGFAEVDKMAQLYNIHLRTGCFCNIGACQKFLQMSSEQIKNNFEAGHVCGDDRDLIQGKPTGSVRISFGYMSTIEDAQYCLKFICECFLDNEQKPDFKSPISLTKKVEASNNLSVIKKEGRVVKQTKVSTHNAKQEEEESCKSQRSFDTINNSHCWSPVDLHSLLNKCSLANRILTNICIYPIKSCGAFEVNEWTICETGLLYDRDWMIVSENGVTISQKREPKLCLIKPHIDLVQKTLQLSYPGMCSVTVPLDSHSQSQSQESTLPCVGKVCGDRITGTDCGDTVGRWISDVLQRPGCRLVRQDKTNARKCRLESQSRDIDTSPMLSLVNESQYLLICRRSVEELHHRISQSQEGIRFGLENLIQRFRANFITGGGQPLEEDSWGEVNVGSNKFMSQGGCSRCQMVCLDQSSGERSKEPLKTLAVWRGRKIPFGIHLQHDSSTVNKTVKVGDIITSMACQSS